VSTAPRKKKEDSPMASLLALVSKPPSLTLTKIGIGMMTKMKISPEVINYDDLNE